MINYKRVSITVFIGIIMIFAAKRYLLDYAINATYFGCSEAALKEYLYYSVENGNKLQKFCNARLKIIKEEFK